MKKDVTKALIFWGIALMILLSLIPIAGADNLRDSVIRIHVLAHSDEESDQEAKLLVRDRLLEYSRENFSLAQSRKEAAREVTKNLSAMEEEAEEVLRESGTPRDVSILLEEEYYPTREYESLRLPAGNYLSLQVKIGEAKGKNWWCVLFPPVCLNTASSAEDALLDAGMEEDNVKIVTREEKRYRVKFRIVELWETAMEKIGGIF